MGDGVELRRVERLAPLGLPRYVRSICLPLLVAHLAEIAAGQLREAFTTITFPDALSSAALFTASGRQFTSRCCSVSPSAALEALGRCGGWVRLQERRLLLHLEIADSIDVFLPVVDETEDAAWADAAIAQLRARLALLRAVPAGGYQN
jgi:hypothetical protein